MLEKIELRCLFRTIKIPAHRTESMLKKTGITQQTKYLSGETLEKEILLAVTEKREFVSRDGSELKAPLARFGF